MFQIGCVFHQDHSRDHRVPESFFLPNPLQASTACHELQIHHDYCDELLVHDSQWPSWSGREENSGYLLLHRLEETHQLFQQALRVSQFGRLVTNIFGLG